MAENLIIGIDPGRYGHGVVVLGPDGEEALRERIANEAAPLEALVDRVVELAGGPGRALWVIEANGDDGAVLIGELLARDELVAALTPTEVAVRRKGRRQVHKSDLIDAEIWRRAAAGVSVRGVPPRNRPSDDGVDIGNRSAKRRLADERREEGPGSGS